MTEAEWSASENPEVMLEFLTAAASDRKLRLFACACCRQIWDWLPEGPSRRAVEASERFADGEITADELQRAWFPLRSVPWQDITLTFVWFLLVFGIFSVGALAFWARPFDRQAREIAQRHPQHT